MSIKDQMEDLIDEAAWRERNGLDPMAEIPFEVGPDGKSYTLRRLTDFEHRQHPAADAYEDMPFVPFGWWLVFLSVVGALAYLAWSAIL